MAVLQGIKAREESTVLKIEARDYNALEKHWVISSFYEYTNKRWLQYTQKPREIASTNEVQKVTRLKVKS